MDFETFGEHQWADTGIFNFFEDFVNSWLKEYDNQFEGMREEIELLKKAIYENKEEVHVQFENGKKEIGEIVEDVKEEI